jgi:hypothetical protein
MLSLEKCRSLLGPDCQLTDSQLEQLRHELYALAHIALDSFRDSKQPACNDTSLFSQIPPADRQEAEERAAIFEFEAGLQRQEAEHKAVDGLSRHPRKRR